MEMRLGKTKVVIEWLRLLMGKVLVVCPVSIIRAWQEELLKEDQFSIALLLGTSKERMEAFSERKKWNLINFEGLLRCPELITNYHWDAIVIDESTRIKNPSAKVTKLLCKSAFIGNSDRRCIMSGYPAPEGPLDYYQQFQFLHGQFMGAKNFWQYRAAGFLPVQGNFNWVPRSYFKDKLRAEVQRKAFILSRKDAGLANQKIYEVRYVKMVPEQKRLMDKLEDEFVLELPEGEKTTQYIPVKLTWMARLAGGCVNGIIRFDQKYSELTQLLKGELAEGQVVVWFRFNAELAYAASRLKAAGISCATIDGSTPESDRAGIRATFNQGGIRVLLIQQKVGMFGLDLSSASTEIYFSNNYSSENRKQSEDRIEHPLKKEPLLIIDLVTEDTVDEDVIKILRRKNRINDYYLLKELASGIQRRSEQRATSGNRSRNSLHGMGLLENVQSKNPSNQVRIGEAAR